MCLKMKIYKGNKMKKTNSAINNLKNTNSPLEKFSNFVIFQTDTGKVNIDVFFQDDTLWLTQKKIAELFEKDRTVIGKHLKNIFIEAELDEKVVCANFAHTTQHGDCNKSTFTQYETTIIENGIRYDVFDAKKEEQNEYFTVDKDGVLHYFLYNDIEFSTLKPYITQESGIFHFGNNHFLKE